MSITDIMPFSWSRRRTPAASAVQPYGLLQRQMNRLFDDFFTGFDLEPFSAQEEAWGKFAPKLNVSEDAKEITVEAELPGMDEKEIQLSLTKDMLTIRGEKKVETEKKEGKNMLYVERSYGSFERVIPLNCAVDEDKVDATFKKGVLTIRLPKTAEAQRETKKISIRS